MATRNVAFALGVFRQVNELKGTLLRNLVKRFQPVGSAHRLKSKRSLLYHFTSAQRIRGTLDGIILKETLPEGFTFLPR